VGFLFFGTELLVELAVKNKKGKTYKIAEAVNAICIVFIGFVGLYIVISGMFQLYRKGWQTLLVLIIAMAYVFYYWSKRRMI
jgi:hypothetical protein